MAAPDFCNFSSAAAAAVAGKDIILGIYDAVGDQLLAVAGQRSLTLNRDADSIEVSSKDTAGGWKSSIAGMKEWSVDTDGLYVANDTSHKLLSKAFKHSDPVCIKVYNAKLNEDLFGGIAFITSYPLEAPYDDAMTYTTNLAGNGELVDLTITVDEFTGTGSQTAFTLSETPGDDLEVRVNGVLQTTGVSASGTTLTFTTAPASGAKIVVEYTAAPAV